MGIRSAALALMMAFVVPAGASADAWTYVGPHPIDLEGHWHDGDEPHEHDTLAAGDGPFGSVDGVRVFLGDPLAFGWDGAVWTYRGAHPIGADLPVICLLRGTHDHPFAPEGAYRRSRDGVYTYRGALRGGWASVRPRVLRPPHPIAPLEPPGGIPPWAVCVPATACAVPFDPRPRVAPAPTPRRRSQAERRYRRADSMGRARGPGRREARAAARQGRASRAGNPTRR